jgi:alkanesulfonate monooxygenase SsuD/methylene tetrahydromethanopterin reductase-like flavin-dependent oxidoreductase (luciferase family)
MTQMRYGMVLPGGTAPEQLEQAILAEQSGWDGVFVWEAGYGVDAWTLLAAIAARTTRIRLGTLLTPLPWRRPWKVASQVVTLDQLSEGRAILAVGLGALGGGLPATGEVVDLRHRAELLDEGIDLMRTLWAGGNSYRGSHYTYECEGDDLAHVAGAVQHPIPIWVVAAWPRPKSMRRALRCDGVVPQYNLGSREPAPADAAAVSQWLAEHGAKPGMDIISEGETPADDPATAKDMVRPWAEAGCTWWLETRWELPHHSADRLTQVRQRLAAGPPG